MIYRAKAPLRLGLAGGGTDVPPFSTTYGGYILNATIDKYVYVTLIVNNTGKISITSQDFEQSVSYDIKKKLPYDGNLDLIKAVINRFKQLYPTKEINGCNLYVRSDAPPGTGLGTSSTVVVAVLGAFLEAFEISMGRYEIAQLAWEIERVDMGYQGGKQDQYCSVFGGINFMEFHKDNNVVVNTLHINKDVKNELQHNLLLCYTGIRHISHDVIKEQIELTSKRLYNLEYLKSIAIRMKDALLTEKLSDFGELLSDDWFHKKELSPKVSNKELDDLAEIAMSAGAEGLKITGAGGGGVFIVYCNWRQKPKIAKAMKDNGCQIIDFAFTRTGLETWSISKIR